MKKRKFLLFLLFAFLSFSVFSSNLKLVKMVCKKRKEMEKRLHAYIRIVDTKFLTYNMKGKLLDQKEEHSELYWDGKIWMEKGEDKNKADKNTEDKIIYPFKTENQQFFNYNISEKKDTYLIRVSLKKEFGKMGAETGEYIISKKTGYFKERNSFLTKMSSPLLKSHRIKKVYKEIAPKVIAPIKRKDTIETKSFLGFGKRIIIITTYKYRKKK